MSLRKLQECAVRTVRAGRPKVGDISDAYFSQSDWTVRYLLVNTGRWLAQRQILISPEALMPRIAQAVVDTTLSLDAIESSPIIARNIKISREAEEALAEHYGWTRYWKRLLPDRPSQLIQTFHPRPCTHHAELEHNSNEHLQRGHELVGLSASLGNGDPGEVDDVLIEQDGWFVRYLTVRKKHSDRSCTSRVPIADVQSIDRASGTVAFHAARDSSRRAFNHCEDLSR